MSALSRAQAHEIRIAEIELGRKGFLNYLRDFVATLDLVCGEKYLFSVISQTFIILRFIDIFN